MPSPFERSRPAVMKASSEPAWARDRRRMVDCRGDDLSGRGHGCPQDSRFGLRAPQATAAYSGRLDQQRGVEQEERWTAEGYRQSAYDYGPKVQRLDESSQHRR